MINSSYCSLTKTHILKIHTHTQQRNIHVYPCPRLLHSWKVCFKMLSLLQDFKAAQTESLLTQHSSLPSKSPHTHTHTQITQACLFYCNKHQKFTSLYSFLLLFSRCLFLPFRICSQTFCRDTRFDSRLNCMLIHVWIGG